MTRNLSILNRIGTVVLLSVLLAAHNSALAEGTHYPNLNRLPDSVSVTTDNSTTELPLAGKEIWKNGAVEVTTQVGRGGLQVTLSAPGTGVKYVQLRWKGDLPAAWKYMGDAVERGYGDLEWKPLDAKRVMPWYFLATDGTVTHGYGVKTGPAALCYWIADSTDITLKADVRCGGTGVQLGGRILNVCTVISRPGKDNESPFATARAFCKEMSPKPRMPKQPVYGFNDWYCAYGNNTASNYLADAAWIISLAPKSGNRPFTVIDDGWQGASSGTGPWDTNNLRFSRSMTMPELAKQLHALGARPGIWCRPLIANGDHPKSWRLARDPQFLDPTVPEVRAYVREMMARLSTWGYELIKHDYSTYDISGFWGFEMKEGFTRDGWAFSDKTRTTAEVILDFYRDIRAGAGDKTLVLGCNTIGHLSAGLFELQRIGDDTSGKEWDRTRKMGVNSLAFRAAQHGTFYAVDGDCVGQVAANSVPWEKNRQWLDLLARSGTPLFVSFPRTSITPEQEPLVRAALSAASRKTPVAEPLNWLDQLTPTRWRLDNSETTFQW